MKSFFLRAFIMSVLLASAFVSSPSFAQETTAAGSLNTQASWTALQNMLNATNGNVSVLRTDVDAIKACAAQGKIWQPGKGCVFPNIDTSLYDKIIACGKLGKVFNGSSCQDLAGNLLWQQVGTAPYDVNQLTAVTVKTTGNIYSSTKTERISYTSHKGWGKACPTKFGGSCSKQGEKCFVTDYNNDDVTYTHTKSNCDNMAFGGSKNCTNTHTSAPAKVFLFFQCK